MTHYEISPEDFSRVMLSIGDIAKGLGVSRNTVAKWKTEGVKGKYVLALSGFLAVLKPWTQPEGTGKPPLYYDSSIDSQRLATQADIDYMAKAIRALARFRSAITRDIALGVPPGPAVRETLEEDLVERRSLHWATLVDENDIERLRALEGEKIE